MNWVLRPSTLALRRVAPSTRLASSFVVKRPSPSAARVAPTPLVFCSAQEWSPRHQLHVPDRPKLSAYSSALTESGFTCIECRFSPPSRSDVSRTSEELLELYTNEIRANLQTLGHPFPPVVFASGFACLIAQAYVSSHPARGLFLVSPPLSNASLYPDILPTPLPEFDYELRFPIAVMGSSDHVAAIKAQTRFAPSAWVDLIQVENLQSNHPIEEVERWVDELGI